MAGLHRHRVALDFHAVFGFTVAMNTAIAALLTLALANEPPAPGNWCKVGQAVMIPDGREGPVTSVNGDICRVLVYGEAYVSLWAYYLIEPAYPKFGR